MARLKRLSVPRWCEWGDELENEECGTLGTHRAPVVPVVVGRDGWYFDRKLGCTWIERSGVAYAYNDVPLFKYEIEVVFPRTLPTHAVVRALVLLERERMLSAEQKHVLRVWRTWMELRQIRTDSGRHSFRVACGFLVKCHSDRTVATIGPLAPVSPS